MKHTRPAPALALLLLAACSSGPDEQSANAVDASIAAENAAIPAAPLAPTPQPANATAPAPTASANVLGLEGLGDLRIGQPVPAASSWAERGAQASDACRTVSSPDFPGVYAIVAEGKVRRITLGARSDVKLAEGFGVGATEEQVNQAFGGFRAEPHKYVEAPAKYLTAPNAASGDPALRFEIGRDGEVSLIHIGTMPVLGYVEGCS